MSAGRKLELRDLVKKTWYHGFDHYMKHAYPDDELRPLSCTGMGYDHENPNNHETNDVLGDFSMTLIDVLDTFVALGDRANFRLAVIRIVEQMASFDLDSKVQVFETTIRVLGGLLSGHLFAKDPDNLWGFRIDGYDDQLLVLAKDLADRLVPAFQASPTGIPYARINLRHGVLQGEGTETCTAGAGSLLLEFATLSRLLGDPVYENVAKKAFYALWDRRSAINLFGNTIDIQTGYWAYGVSSIGAGIDSFYEYILKSHVLLQDDSFLEMWNQAYKAVMTYMRSPDGFWYRGVNMQTGAVATTTIDSLSAFWPGLQVLAGDIEAAIQSHMTYANLWARYSGIPEVFDVHKKQATSLGYPLRPEFVESNYFLYRATKDEYYLDVAERVITDLVNRTWVDCGLASIANLLTGKLEDRQHSFMLSETLKYLYLTFDEDNPINHADQPFVFTTEGHILYIPDAQDMPENLGRRTGWEERESLESDRVAWTAPPRNRTRRASVAQTCSVFAPSLQSAKHSNPLMLSITGRSDFDYARMITGSLDAPINSTHAVDRLDERWASCGMCEVPVADLCGDLPAYPSVFSPFFIYSCLLALWLSACWSCPLSSQNEISTGSPSLQSNQDHLIELIFSHSAEDIERNPGPDKVEFFGPSSASSAPGTGPPEPKRNMVPLDSHASFESSPSSPAFVLVKNLTGLTFSLRKRFDQDSYEIVKVGAYELSPKTQVVLSDPYAIKVLQPQNESEQVSQRDRDHLTGIRVYYEGSVISQEPSQDMVSMSRAVMMATFGPDVRKNGSTDLSLGNLPLEVVGLNPPNEYGCMPIPAPGFAPTRERPEDVRGKVLLVKRGECTFADKVEAAVAAGARAIIVANEDDTLLIPTSDRIQSRDAKENLVLTHSAPPPSSSEAPAPTEQLSTPVDVHHHHEKLKSIPLLFSTLETGRSIGTMLANRQPLLPGSLRNRKLLIEIVDNPLDLLTHPETTSATPTHHQPIDDPSKYIVINGYKLSNLILKK
ncbi:hypothetical protein PtB15_18B283 [Puccinia triticina]|nr:hypothetical protein PtB15_18B283 [Puccinia triticina]